MLSGRRAPFVALVVWAGALGLMAAGWSVLPDIAIADRSGNGCGKWDAAALREHAAQLPVLLGPVVLAQAVSTYAVSASGGWAKGYRTIAAAATVGMLAVVAYPLTVLFVWAQLLGSVLFPLFALWALVAVFLPGSLLRHEVTLALIAPVAATALFTTTRVPWVYAC